MTPGDFGEIGAMSAFDGVDEGLRVVRELLAKSPRSGSALALQREVESCERIVARWSAFPPTGAQVHAMLECVAELVAMCRSAGQDESGVYQMIRADRSGLVFR